MPISGVSTTQLPFFENLTAPQTFSTSAYMDSYSDSSDEAVLNHSAASFKNLVREAGAMPEVRDEMVDYFKARIRSGHYPSEEIVAGLTNLIGGAIALQVKAGLSSPS